MARVDSFDHLAFLPTNRPAKTSIVPSDQLPGIAAGLRKNAANRPKRRAALVAFLRTHLGAEFAAQDPEALLGHLLSFSRITIDAKGAVDYSALDA